MFEDFLEVEEVFEVLGPVFLLFHENADFDESKDDLAQVVGRVDPPVFENGTGQGAEPLHREPAGAIHQLLPGNMAPFVQFRNNHVQSVYEKDVRSTVKAGIPLLEPGQDLDGVAGIHDA